MAKRVNLYGGPCSGKSTTAAALYANLKIGKYKVELVNEWIKAWAWQGIKPTGYDQCYILTKQLRKEDVILRNGGIIVSDSPILMQIAYAKKVSSSRITRALLDISREFEAEYPSVNIFLSRAVPYQQEGRYEDEREAIQMDGAILDIIDDEHLKYAAFPATDIALIYDHVCCFIK